jgi:hypothetical protein
MLLLLLLQLLLLLLLQFDVQVYLKLGPAKWCSCICRCCTALIKTWSLVRLLLLLLQFDVQVYLKLGPAKWCSCICRCCTALIKTWSLVRLLLLLLLLLQFDVQVYLKLGPARVVVPIHISHIQYKALARVVLNMVDTIPCIGAQDSTVSKGSGCSKCVIVRAATLMCCVRHLQSAIISDALSSNNTLVTSSTRHWPAWCHAEPAGSAAL